MQSILLNHMLEPPGQVTGITRFLFSLTAGLLRTSPARYVLATAWNRDELPDALKSPRLEVRTVPFHRSTVKNIVAQNRILPGLMAEAGTEAEFNCNPLGGFVGTWPRMITVHDLYYRLMPSAYPLRHRLVWRALFPLSAGRASAILAPSNATRRDLARFYPGTLSKVAVVHEAPAMIGAIEPRAPLLGGRHGIMVGNISPNKNVESIIAALGLLAETGLSVPLLHVGRDEMGAIRTAQSRLAEPLPVTSVSGIDDAALHAAFKRATFFINASLFEGFCLPLVEAQACGTPVIASNRSALPEVAGRGAILVDPESPREIAEAIHSVWTDEELAGRLSALGKANAARFSWDKAAREVTAVLDRIVLGEAPAVTPVAAGSKT